MYQHSLNVKNISLRIAESVECDETLLAIEALFHDIGKAYKADPKILRERHAELGYDVTKAYLPVLDLRSKQLKELTDFLQGHLHSTEAQIVKDADIIAFFLDEDLQNKFKDWADKQELPDELQRKADKLGKLRFDISKQITLPLHKKMRKKWQLN